MTTTFADVALTGDAEWSECLCSEIDSADVPCIVCTSREIQGLPPCDALVFEYGGAWWEFAGYVEPVPGEPEWDERRNGWCLYGFPLDEPLSRPDLPGLIFNYREIRALTPAMQVALRTHLSVSTDCDGYIATHDAEGEEHFRKCPCPNHGAK
jgi:hypothetical protein